MNSKKRQTKLFAFKYYLYDWVKWTGALPMLAFLRPKVIYTSKQAKKKHRGGFLIASNHIGFTDPLVLQCIFWYRRVYSIAMQELLCSKIRVWFFTRMLCIPVDRGNFNMSTFRKVCDAMESGSPVTIFPEGGIKHEQDTVGGFKSGAVMMALRAKKPIVPVYIAKRKNVLHRQRVVIGEAIDVNEICGDGFDLQAVENASIYLRKKELELIELFEKGTKQ